MAEQSIGLSAVLDDRNFQAGLARYSSGIGSMTKLTDGAASVLSGAFFAATGIAVAGIGALVAASKIGLDATLAWAEGLDKLGDQFGLSGQVASGWQFLMNKVGLSVDEGAQGLNYFTNQLADFGKASKTGELAVTPFTTALGKLGINAKDSKGKLKDFDTIMPEIMDQFSKLPAGVNASALAMDLFGARGGTKFLDFLRQGGAGLKNATAMAEALGLSLSTDEVNSAEEFGFAMNELNLGLTGFKNTIGRAVLPIARQFVDWLNQKIIPALVSLAKKYVPLMIDGLRNVVQKLKPLITVAGYLFDLIRGKQVVIEDFAGVIGDLAANFGFGKQQVVKFVNEFLRGIQRVADGWKNAGIGGVLAQLAQEFAKAWPAIQAQLTAWGTQFWGWLTGPNGALAQAGGQIATFAKGLGTALQANWPAVSAQFVVWRDQFWTWLTGKGGALEQVGTEIWQVASAIASWLETNWTTTIKPELMTWSEQFWGWINDKGGVLDTVGDRMGDLTIAISNWATAKTTHDDMSALGEAIATAVMDGLASLFGDPKTGNDTFHKLDMNLTAALEAAGLALLSIGIDIATGIGTGISQWFDANGPAIGEWIQNSIRAGVAYVINGTFLHDILEGLVNAWNAVIAQFHFNMPWDTQPPEAPTPPPGPNSSPTASRGPAARALASLTPLSRSTGAYYMPTHAPGGINNARTIGPGAVVINLPGGSNLTASQVEAAAYRAIARVMNEA